jgi:NitT/TauT family transport system permease protein
LKVTPNASFYKALFGFVAFGILWELAGRYGLLGPSFPPLSEIATALFDERSRFQLQRATFATLYASFFAFVIGTFTALLLALISSTLPITEKGINTLASGLYAVPPIAFGPVLILLAGTANTAIVLGALSTYFPIFVALTSALRQTPGVYRDLAGSYGAPRSATFFRLSLPYSIPAFVDGLRLGAPASVLGVILGEWFGASRGLGVLIISSLQNVQIVLLWASAIVSIACTFGAYLLLTALYRWSLNRYAW